MAETKPGTSVFLKLSGERMAMDLSRVSPSNDYSDIIFDLDRIRGVVQKIAQVHATSEKLGVGGLTVVTGGGNQGRGDKLRAKEIAPRSGDAIGRISTVTNTLVIRDVLEGFGVATATFLPENMKVEDPDVDFQTYNAEALSEAHDRGQVALIAGGLGRSGITTDTAVMQYARWHSEAGRTDDVVVLKGTQVDGVYEDDPKKTVNAKRYSVIGAQYMLDYPERFRVVDTESLELLRDSLGSVRMIVFAEGGHDIETVLSHRDDHRAQNGLGVGTLVLAGAVEAEF